jgi:hypothetical protein
MLKFAQTTHTIADALQRARASAVMGDYGYSGMGGPASLLASITGADPFKADPFARKFLETAGSKAFNLQRGTTDKLEAFLGHLPMVAGLAGGAWLVNKMYNSWKNKQVADEILDDPEFSHYDRKSLRNALTSMHNYSPSLLRDPITARQLAKRSVEFDGLTLKDITEMMQSEKLYRESQGVGNYTGPITDIFTKAL